MFGLFLHWAWTEFPLPLSPSKRMGVIGISSYQAWMVIGDDG
jgi:hypothetical protein